MKLKSCFTCLLLASSLILTGCSDVIEGTDAVKPVNHTATGTHGTQLDLNTHTQATIACERLFNFIAENDYESALKCLDIPDSSFITADDLKNWVTENISGTGKLLSCSEYTKSGIRYVDCELEDTSEPVTLMLTPVKSGTSKPEVSESGTSKGEDKDESGTNESKSGTSEDESDTSKGESGTSEGEDKDESGTNESEPEASQDIIKDWLITLPNFVITGQIITAPADMPISLDDKDLSGCKTVDNNIATYSLPALVYGTHKISIKTVFDTITSEVQLTSAPVDMSEYLYIADPRRSQILESYAVPLLKNVNQAIVKNDWGKFTGYFDPELDSAALNAFSVAFNTGYKLKSRVYDLKMLSNDSAGKLYARDLGEPLNVRYISYDTIEATFGTRWQFAPSGEFEKQEDGSITVSSTSEMKIINTLQLRYKNKKWYLVSINDDSLAKIASDLEQWR